MKTARNLLVLGCVAALCAGAFLWQMRRDAAGLAAADRELYEVALAQLKAFQNEDFSGAYRHASSEFQSKWSVADFTTMIRREYATMLQPVRVELGPVRYHGQRATVELSLVSRSGRAVPCVYSFVHEDGRWRIDGAQLFPPVRPGVFARQLQT
jgi:hypothetical protein